MKSWGRSSERLSNKTARWVSRLRTLALEVYSHQTSPVAPLLARSRSITLSMLATMSLISTVLRTAGRTRTSTLRRGSCSSQMKPRGSACSHHQVDKHSHLTSRPGKASIKLITSWNQLQRANSTRNRILLMLSSIQRLRTQTWPLWHSLLVKRKSRIRRKWRRFRWPSVRAPRRQASMTRIKGILIFWSLTSRTHRMLCPGKRCRASTATFLAIRLQRRLCSQLRSLWRSKDIRSRRALTSLALKVTTTLSITVTRRNRSERTTNPFRQCLKCSRQTRATGSSTIKGAWTQPTYFRETWGDRSAQLTPPMIWRQAASMSTCKDSLRTTCLQAFKTSQRPTQTS